MVNSSCCIQPIVNVWTGEISCVEALVRWRHPVRGLMLPERFIPIAESTGLIVDLGEWVLRQACRDAKAWPEHVKVAVNLSAVQFRSDNLLDAIRLALNDAGLAPSRLEIEVTESVLIDRPSSYIAFLSHFAEYRCVGRARRFRRTRIFVIEPSDTVPVRQGQDR